MRSPTDEAETHGNSAASSSSCDHFSLLSWEHHLQRWCSQQPQSNLIATSSPSLQAFMDAISWQEVALTLLKNLGSSCRNARDRGGEPANHSEAAVFGPSPAKFKPRKFAKTDVVGKNTSSVPKPEAAIRQSWASITPALLTKYATSIPNRLCEIIAHTVRDLS
ncbi:hypothetical protein E2C01_023854 [Portunus trituberculatus]|uniref:Uncharacterized protein n=1 Tax=Portunus trituberculatus TaxID=210409 RepID=A0A5B7EB40_PORTR|nr:hypothetical protein [Portunus trituberculatus]